MARRLSLSEIAKRAEKLAHYGTDSDRSTYALRGVDRPLGKRRVRKQLKIYLKPGEQPPEGAQVHEGPRRGRYYVAEGREGAARVFGGKPVALAHKPSKLETGEIGEKIALQLLLEQGFGDARRLSVEEAQNFPVDVMADHHVVEVKAGLVSNGESAQHWRATIGQPGPKEAAWLKAATPEEKAAWNRTKGKAAIERKQQVLMAIGRERGIRLKAKTYGIILNTDTRQADIFVIDGFHERVGWKSELAQHSYVGTVSF